MVASNGGGDPPGWFLDLQDDPIVAVQVKADHHTARARVATAEEKPELWRIMTATGAPYDEFQARPTARSRWWSSSRDQAERPVTSTTPNAPGATSRAARRPQDGPVRRIRLRDAQPRWARGLRDDARASPRRQLVGMGRGGRWRRTV